MVNRTLGLFLVWALSSLSPPVSAQKDTYEVFVENLSQSVRVGDEKRIDKAVRDNPVHALSHYRGLVLSMVRNPEADNSEDRKVLETAWLHVFEGRTLDYMNRWLQTLDASGLRSYDQAQVALAKAYSELNRLQSTVERDRKSFEALRDSLMKIAEAFEGIGDPLDAADAWGVVARVYTVMPERTLADRKDGVYAMERFLDLRARWEWTKDQYFLGNQNWLKAEKEAIKTDQDAADKRTAEGYGDNVKGVDAYLMPGADAAEKSGELKFEVFTKPKPDMSPQGGSIPMLWPSVGVTNTGPSPFVWFKGVDLFLVRPGLNDFGVTLVGSEPDLAKNPFVEVEVSNKLKAPAVFKLDADGKRSYAMWMFVGGAQEPFMGLNQNLEPGKDSAIIYYKSAGSWIADVAGTAVRFFDDNTNGILFEEDPMAYGLKDRNVGAGPDDEVRIPAFDAMQVGKGAIGPYSEWIEIDDSWYHVRGLDDGTRVGLRAVNPDYFKTGTLQLDWAGGKGTQPAVLIVQGRGDFKGARYDLSSGKPVELPVGEYTVEFGRIEQGKGARMITANVFPGVCKAVKVEEGKAAKFELGAPFRIDFTKRDGDKAVVVDGVTMRVRGRGGEIYTHLNGAAISPVVLVSRAEDGKGAKEVGEFTAIHDADTLNLVANGQPNLGSHVGFYPVPKGSKGETTMKVSVPEGYFVGLQEKKHKLFGKLDPIFK